MSTTYLPLLVISLCFSPAHCLTLTKGGREYGKMPVDTESCSTEYSDNYKNIIYVDPTKPKGNSSDCDHLKESTMTCSNINAALHYHQNSTVYVLAYGENITHILEPDKSNSISFFRDLTSIGFFGSSKTEVSRVVCLSGAGLAFWNVNDIKLQNVEFSFCGALRNTTSKDFTVKDSFYPVKVTVGLLFYNGTNVDMCHVAVQDGTPGTVGVVMYDTDGTVSIYNSNFKNNTITTDTPRPGGGGFVVEFSFCVLGDLTCSTVQTTHISNSSYTFRGCSFTDNSATSLRTNRLWPSNQTHEGFGRGGGLAVYFKGSASSNTIQILHCHFEHNHAIWGGAMVAVFGDLSLGNSIVVDKTAFIYNECYNRSSGFGGGAIRILSILHYHLGPLLNRSVSGNSMNISGYFIGNSAKNGGAISFSPSRQTRLDSDQAIYVNIMDSVFYENEARVGAAIHVELHPMYVYGVTNRLTIESSVFQYNTIEYSYEEANYDIGIGVVYSFWIPIEFLCNVSFSHNYGSAIALIGTHALFYEANVTFDSNSGDTGGAIALLESNFLINENTTMLFINNFAHQGGAIYNYIASQGVIRANLACFVRYQNPFLDRKEWKGSFKFINNTATSSTGNSIFSTSIYPCTLSNTEENVEISASLLFCINPSWDFNGMNCTDEIETKGNTYMFTNSSTIMAFPGKGFELPVKVLDDLNHDITNSMGYMSTVASIANDSILAQVDPKFTLTSNNYLVITGEENYSVPLVLQSSGSRPHRLKMNVMIRQCPPGFYFTTPEGSDEDKSKNDTVKLGECECQQTYSFRDNLNCSQQTFEAQIPWNYWIGVDPTGQSDVGTDLVMSRLPNIYSEQDFQDRYYFVLPKRFEDLDENICGVRNRTGPICGKCKENFSTSVNSYNYMCVQCDDETPFLKNILLFMTLAYLPYFVLLAAIAYFNLKLTSSAASGFILFAQMISIDIFDINGSSKIDINRAALHQSYSFVYGLFNFNSFADVMKPFCIGKNFTTLHVLLLEYTLAALPLFLIIVTFVLLRLKNIRCMCCQKQRIRVQESLSKFPRASSRRKKKPKKESSLIHTLVAFILLTYTKLSLVSMKLLATQKFFGKDGSYRGDPRIFLAGHLSFSSKEYLLPYGLIAIFVVVVFVMIPPLFLLGLPNLINRLLDKEKFRCLRRFWPTLTIHIFLDAFQGFYKPNRRHFAGLYFVFRLVILFIYVWTTNYFTTYILQQVFIVIMIILIAFFKPYRREIFNVVDTLIFLNLSLINLISTYVYSSSISLNGLSGDLSKTLYVLQFCFLWLPLIYILLYLIFKLTEKTGLRQYVSNRMKFGQNRGSQEEHLSYYTNNSDVGETLSHSDVNDDDDDVDGRVDSLSDDALFSRAEDTNTFLPPPKKRANQQRRLQSMVSNRARSDESSTLSVGLDTESTTENSY